MYGEPSAAVVRRKFPQSQYGRIYVKRGIAGGENILNYGSSWAEATDEQRQKREEDGYRGRGGYIGRSLGRFVGSKVGIPGSAQLGAKVGDWVGDQVWGKTKSWLGMGGYHGQGAYGKGTANSLIQGSNRTPPMFGSVHDETGALIVSHREYVGDIFGPESTARNFKNRTYDLNPGIEKTFPWLSQIAQNYEEYEFGQLVFEFKSTVNPSVSGDGQMGTIVMVTNYNSGARPFDDKNTCMQYDGSQSCRSTQHAVHGVECDPAKYSGSSGHYVRTGPMPDEDIKSYDHGKFQIATVGMPSNFDNDPIGELWVYYTVKLRKPRLFSGKGLNLSRDVFVLNQTPGGSLADSSTAVWAQHASNSLGCSLSFVSAVNLDNSVATSDAGHWRITFPSSYTGNLELKLRCTGNFSEQFNSTTGNADNDRTKALMNLGFMKYVAPGSMTLSMDREIHVTGNVTQIKDMFGTYPSEQGSSIEDTLKPTGLGLVVTAYETDGMNDMLIATAHIRVGVATGGVENSIIVSVPKVDSTSSEILQSTIDVSEYNTFNADPTSQPEGKYVTHDTKVAIDPKQLTGF